MKIDFNNLNNPPCDIPSIVPLSTDNKQTKVKCTLSDIIYQKEDFIIATFEVQQDKDNNKLAIPSDDLDKIHSTEITQDSYSGKYDIKSTIKAKGNLLNPSKGNVYTLIGSWEYNSRYGKTLKFTDYETTLPVREKDIVSYLSENAFGIGPLTARKFVDLFGKDTLKMLREKSIEEIQQIVKDNNIRLFRTDLIERLKERLIEIEGTENLYFKSKFIFEGTTLSKKTIFKILNDFGGDAIEKIKQNPYALIDNEDYSGIGFRTADRIAHNVGYNMKSNDRYIAGIIFALQEFSSKEGHVYISRHLLNNKLYNEFRLEIKDVENCLNILETSGKVTIIKDNNTNEERVYLSSLYNMEKFIAMKLYDIMSDEYFGFNNNCNLGMDSKGKIDYKNLQVDQQLALDLICHNKVSILTGCPGTGKSYTLKAIVENYKGCNLKLCAPTGKAAKRMQELSGVPVTYTIHKLLEPQKNASGKFEFTRNEDNPIDVDFLIVDEVSMVGVDLMYFLLRAIDNSTKVLFIGDSYQLPSISPGLILLDMINSKKIPSVELSVIKRQDPGRIITNCHAIKNGNNIVKDNSKTSDFFLIEKEDEDIILSEIVELYKSDRLKSMRPNLNNIIDIQIMSPHNSITKLSCEFINNTIQQSVNNKSPFVFKTNIKINDKVVNVKNNYKLGILNGDIGIVLDGIEDLDEKGTMTKFFKVKFLYPEREVKVPVEEHNLKLGYCLSVHKLQGSSAPIIIMPFFKSFSGLLMMRNLLYTAVSRAEKLFIGVGHINTIPAIIKRVRVTNRNTTLREFIVEIFKNKGRVSVIK